mmetsp:Transcript_42966/g.99514  ORF Transcript_42966/g.99514 Transcript_42966/m.99514 type:complete len:137 (-) Transcript_42966:116-526(-)
MASLACTDAVKQAATDAVKEATTEWERLVSSASTCADSKADTDSEGEWDTGKEGAESEADAVLSVLFALVLLGGAVLVWLYMPMAVSCALLAFTVLEVAWFAVAPSAIPTIASSCLLTAVFACGCVVLLACQTPQL